MAIDDNTIYGLYGSQIKELPGKIEAVKGQAKALTTADYDYPSGSPAYVALWNLDDGLYELTDGTNGAADAVNTINGGGVLVLVGPSGSGFKTIVWFKNNEAWLTKTNTSTGAVAAPSYPISLTGPTVVQTTGTSTTDVMSQNAVTSMIFADPSTKRKVRIGNNAAATGDYDPIAIGVGSSASGSYSIALGALSKAGREAATLGYNADASYRGSVAIGANSKATYVGEVNIGTSSTSDGYNSSNYRLLTGLYDPQSDHDAATKGYVDSVVLTNAGAPTTATVGAKGQLLEDTTNGNLYQCTNVSGNTYTWKRILAGAGGTRRATISGWDTSGTLDYVHGQNIATDARGALFYAGTDPSDFPKYVGIGIDADQADLGGYTPYLLTQQVSDDGTGTLSGQTAARRIAVYDEIPATFTTNEWNALWA